MASQRRLRLLSAQVLAEPCSASFEQTQPLRNKVAIVTGASQGVGKGIALALAKAGCRVYITGRNRKAIDASAQDINMETVENQCIAVECDHGSDEATEKLFDLIKTAEHRLDICVNNVTMNLSHVGKRRSHSPTASVGWWESDTLDEWDVTTRVGLRSYYHCALLSARIMVPQGNGLIVNISSFGGVRRYIGLPHTIVKTGTDRMAADAAVDLERHNVAFVSLYPGLVKTEKMLATPAGPKIAKSKAAESPEFVGRSIVALAADPSVVNVFSGKVVFSSELAEHYGFTDVDGRLPYDRVMKSVRAEMHGPPSHWLQTRQSHDPVSAHRFNTMSEVK